MRALLLLFTLLITLESQARSSLGIYVVPAASKLNWSSTLTLISSFQKSLAKASLQNGLHDAPKKAIGHVVLKMECSGLKRWTSISIDPARMTPLILKYGVDGMFAESSHGYMQSEDEIRRFVLRNAESAIAMRVHVSDEACQEMVRWDNHLRAQKTIWFGPLINSRERAGGTGSTYAAAFAQLAGFMHPDLWLEKVSVPGTRKDRTFYSVQSMYEFARNERAAYPSRAFVEEITYQNKKVRLNAVEL